MIHTRRTAAGEDGAVQAQPLRHRVGQGGGGLWPHACSEDATRTSQAWCEFRTDSSAFFASMRSATTEDLLVSGSSGSRACWCGSTGRSTPRRSRRRTSTARSWSCSLSAFGRYTEADVYDGSARVYGLEPAALRGIQPPRHERVPGVRLQRGPTRHGRCKTFSFPIDRDGSRTVQQRSGSAGDQDGLDLITALALHPETVRRLARKFWQFLHQRSSPAGSRLHSAHGRRLPAERR